MKTNHKGYEILIEQDNNPINPRMENANLGNMLCKHRRYSLGDENNISIQQIYHDVLDMLNGKKKDVVVLPLYLYDHSGITMNTTGFSCPWDSGLVGCIYADYNRIRSWYGVKKVTKNLIEKVKDMFRSEVKVYDNYISGNVYCYTILKDNEEMDSCGGYPYEDALLEAKAIVDNMHSHKKMVTA
jgi:hypothetical protein